MVAALTIKKIHLCTSNECAISISGPVVNGRSPIVALSYGKIAYTILLNYDIVFHSNCNHYMHFGVDVALLTPTV